jgi:UDP-N-acetylglucosamine--N-acetylmuramyl-(pentapeptide) pyrophosphoryl-undecaprenol N-acetylglucosamine transferase
MIDPVPGAGRLRALAFFGGGTGGHLFPGIAVAERARERFPGCRAVFFRTARAVEEKAFEGRGLETRALSIGSPGGGVAGWVRYAREAARAMRETRASLRSGFDVAFGLGGYASLPGILASRAEGVPVILLEQNRVAGKVNRLLGPFAAAVASSFEGTALPLGTRVELTGNPVRREVLEAARLRRSVPREGPGRTVLAVGGSQGASGLNRRIREALPLLSDLREGIRWIHVAGDADKDVMREAYRTEGWEAEIFGYTARLPELMARSDLAVGRAGGTTLSEIAVLGLPAVLVPYPHHADRHQLENALALARAGGARLLPEAELGAASLRAVFEEVLLDPERLAAMERAVLRTARPGAADAVIDLALEISSEKSCPPAFASSS